LFSGDAVLLRRSLVPLSFLEVECADRAGNVDNGTVLGVPVLINNATEGEVVLVRHEVDSTFA
jgi:hypothetical protein